MSDKEMLQALYSWSDGRRFQVNDMSNDEVEKFISLAKIRTRPTNIGKRSSVGEWLTDNNGLECAISANTRLKLVVLEWADDNNPGWYQVQRL